MPFTFCHPAVVLPFNYLPWKWRSITGLVAGSIAPDFEYFFRVQHYSTFSHTIPGLFWFDLPLGVAIVVIFHNLIRDPLIENSPGFLQQRSSHYYRYNWNGLLKKRWLIIVLSVLVGAISHLLWDSFTHETANELKTLPFKKGFQAITKGKMNAYSLYTQVTSAVAAVIIIYAAWQLPVRKKIRDMHSKTKYWLFIAGLTTLCFFLLYLAGFGEGFEDYVIMFVDAFLVALVIVSLLFTRSRRNQFQLVL